MMIELLRLSISIAAVTFIGFNLLWLISAKRLKFAALEALAISYGLGFGMISLEMLLFSMMGMDFTVPGILAPWSALVVLNLLRYLILKNGLPICDAAEPIRCKASLLDKFLMAGIGFELLYALFRSLVKPIESYDAIAIYAIRSKIFYLAGSVTQDYLANIARLFPHADYPLNIQLSETFLYISMGSLNDQLVKVIFPLFFAAILCIFYYAVRRISGPRYALIFTFVLAGIPHFNNYATNAYLEVPLAFYIFAGFLFLLRWIEDRSRTNELVLSAIAVAMAGWTKNEGLLYCVIFSVLVFTAVASGRRRISGKDILYAFVYSGIIISISLPWSIVKARWHIVNDEIALANLNPANLVRQIDKLGPVFYELQKQLFGPKKWNIFWPVMISALLIYHRRVIASPQRYITAAIVMALGGYILFYMISYVDVVFFASKTWARFLLDLLPIAVYLVAVILKDEVKC